MHKKKHTIGKTEEVNLFRKTLSDVIPLNSNDYVESNKTRPRPIPRQSILDDKQTLKDSLTGELTNDLTLEAGEELRYVQNGLGHNTLRKLRRGHWILEAELDLHGFRSQEAKEAIILFIRDCMKNRFRCIRIIHGKGLGSKNREPVLKNKLGHWLRQRSEVMAFCQAQPSDGGSGATVVLLRSSSKRKIAPTKNQ